LPSTEGEKDEGTISTYYNLKQMVSVGGKGGGGERFYQWVSRTHCTGRKRKKMTDNCSSRSLQREAEKRWDVLHQLAEVEIDERGGKRKCVLCRVCQVGGEGMMFSKKYPGNEKGRGGGGRGSFFAELDVEVNHLQHSPGGWPTFWGKRKKGDFFKE